MENRYGLNDGTVFILDCDKEPNPAKGREDKLSFLLSLNLEAMVRDKRWSVDAVRALATCLVQTTVKGSRLNKAQLLDNLRVMQDAEREARKLRYVEMFERHSQPTKFEQDVDTFASMLNDPNLTIEEIAEAILDRLKRRFLTPASLVKTGVVEFKNLARLHDGVSRVNQEKVEKVLKHLSVLVRPENKELKIKDTQQIVEMATDRRKVKPSVLYDHAIKVLSNPEYHTWKELSIALAFVTGRRCSEIHGTKTWFKVTGEYQVEFYGQLKVRTREATDKDGNLPPYEIPTIVPADLVVKGWEALRATEKVYPSPKTVNARLTKPLNDDLPTNLKTLMGQASATKYKDLRKFYAVVILQSKPEAMMEDKFISMVMGHSDWDLNTSNTYRTFYTTEKFDPITHEPIERD